MKNLSLLFIAFLFLQINLVAQSGWVSQTSGTTENLNSVFFINESVGWAVGESGVIIYSSDGGANWNPQNSNTTDDLYSVKFIDESVGWIIKGEWHYWQWCPSSGILKTSTGGQSWNSINTPGPSYFLTPDIGWANNEGAHNIHYKTTNGGLSWDTLYISGGGVITILIYYVNENLGFTSNCTPFGVGSCGLGRTSDGGYTWNGIESLMVGSLSFVDNNTGWGCFEVPDPSVGGFLKKTEDGGESWIEQLYTTAAPEYFGYVDFVNQEKGWITGGSSPDSIMFTTDGGENWNTQSIGDSAELNSIYFVDENIGWAVGENGKILHTTTGGVVSVEGETNGIPNKYNLHQNYPNPFNPKTKIQYSVPQTSNVVIKIFDILGNEIETLVNEEKQTGTYEITWYAEGLPSGIYFYRLQAGSFVETKKMVLMK